jgi:hypothetical protein
MLLFADGLFRLDVVISGDALATIVRNLSAGDLNLVVGAGGEWAPAPAFGDAAVYEPGRAGMALALDLGDDQIVAGISIATLRFAHRGTIRVTAQAVVRRRPRR